MRGSGAICLFGSNFTPGDRMRAMRPPGSLYQTLKTCRGKGLSFLVGGGHGQGVSSVWLPDAAGYTLTPLRQPGAGRGALAGREDRRVLRRDMAGPEFTAQPAGQIVGAIRYARF